jgi:hypothetical protein
VGLNSITSIFHSSQLLSHIAPAFEDFKGIIEVFTPLYHLSTRQGCTTCTPTINICDTRSRAVTKVDTFGNIVPSWLVTPHSSFTMSDSYLSLIWSKYIHSPNPESGMATLCDTCVALLNYTLFSSHLVPAIAGVALHPELAESLREVFPILKHPLYAAAEHRGALQPLFDCDHTDFWLATIIGVPRDEVVPAWAQLTHKLVRAMCCLEYLCSGAPLLSKNDRGG